MSAPDQAAPISTDDLRKLVDAVTPGKWRKHGNGQQIFGGKEGQIIATMIYGGVSKANSRLIALAPQLAAEVLARRADLAAPSAPAEVEGLVELWPSSSTSAFGDNQRWVRSKDYAALQAENERLRGERDAWKANAEALADLLDTQTIWVTGSLTCKDHPWDEDQAEAAEYSSTEAKLALAAYAKLKGDV